jgi:parvulin-like peptidyl-prolyl isomerase
VGAKSGQRGKAGKGSRAAGRQRLGLIVFSLLFVLLFIGFAIAQGISSPSVPSGDVAMVEDVPEEIGAISQEEFDRVLEQQAAAAKLKAVPKPGDDQYEEVKKAALEELINAAWLEGQAEETGITVTEGEVEKELEKIKKQSFPTPKAYEKFLEESKYTQEDVNERVRLQILGTKIQEKVTEEAPKPAGDQIEAYYEAEKATKFATKESRDVRFIINEEKAKVDAAKKALEKDNSPGSWKKVAAKYSSDPTSSSKGGLQPGIQEEFLPQQLKAPIFDVDKGELNGPIKVEKNYFLIEVVKLTPAKTKPLKEVEGEVTSTLEQEGQQEFFAEFVTDYQSKWRSRTYCADDYLVELCANFKGSGRPANAPAACYEADPKEPANECPAPVTQTQPALPGTVTEVKPKGEPFVQRPLPEQSEEQGTVVPGGGAPEGGAPPPEGAEEAPPAGE